jgi:hypothetical protein
MKKIRPKFLKEDIHDQPTMKSEGDTLTAEISLDQRIDALFTQYEQKALPQGAQDPLQPGTSPTETQAEGVLSLKKILKEIFETVSNESAVPMVALPIKAKKKDIVASMKKEVHSETIESELPLRVKKNTIPSTELSTPTLRSLFEADEPPDLGGDDAPPDLGGGDDAPPVGGDDTGGGGDGEEEPKEPHTPEVDGAEVNKPKININSFARDVARLSTNFRDLLDPQRIILNRAKAYITRNYDEQAAEQLMKVLDLQYNVRPVKTEKDFGQVPAAAGAGGEPSGGGGGGGPT